MHNIIIVKKKHLLKASPCIWQHISIYNYNLILQLFLYKLVSVLQQKIDTNTYCIKSYEM